MVILAGLLAACQSSPQHSSSAGETRAPAPPTARSDAAAKPLAYVNGEPVLLGQMMPPLIEAAGGEILSELALDRLIQNRLQQKGLSLSAQRIAAEEEFVRQTLSDDPDDAARLLEELRQRRGLGPQRFASLLRRNAGLRLLVQDEVQISQAAIEQEHQLIHGPRYQGRLIVVGNIQQANTLRQEILQGAAFTDVAASFSTDSSAAQGGLLAPISPADASYPQSIRDTLMALDKQPQPVSDVVVIDGGFALLKLERKIEGDSVELADVKDELTQRVRRRLERILMQRQARSLLSEADIVVLDPALGTGWQRQKKQLINP